MPSTQTDRLDGLTTSVAVKAPCKAYTTAALTQSGEQTIGGVACVDGDRYLRNVSPADASNGIWVVRTSAHERAKDFNGQRDVVQGTLVIIASSDETAIIYRVTTTNSIVVGTTAIEFAVSGVADSANLSFVQNGSGAVTRSMESKGQDILHVNDFGAIGTGLVDDATAIADGIAESVARGVELHFDGSATYLVASASWAITAGARLRTNGATIVSNFTTTGDTVWLTIGAGCVIDELNVSVPTGIRRDRAILIDGDDVQIGRLKLHSIDQQDNSAADDGGVQITGDRPFVAIVDIKNYDRPLIVRNTTDCTILRVLLENYVRGAYCYDNTGLLVSGGHIHGASPNADGSPGDNGVLLSCTATDAQRNCAFENVVVEDATEHAWRIGGPEQQSNLRFSNCSAFNAGGCGFKVLGTDAGAPSATNKNITLDNFIAEDVGTNAALSATNRVGILMKFAQRVQVSSPIVRKKNEAFSAQYGMVIDGSDDVNVTAPIFNDAEYDGILMWASDGDIQYPNVNGGTMRNNGRYGAYLLVDATMTMSRPRLDGLNLESNVGNAFRINNAGTFTGGFIRTISAGNAGTGESNSTTVVMQLTTNAAEVAGTPLAGISASNSSWAADATNFSILKAGVWTAL